ncbi:MAG: hypothetical protein ACRD4P_04590 [Bryobacteraceae bacterium]
MNSWLTAIEQLEEANTRLAAAPLDDPAEVSAILGFREGALEILFHLPGEELDSNLLERLGAAYETGESILQNLLTVRESLREEVSRLRHIEQVQGARSSQHFAALVDLQG